MSNIQIAYPSVFSTSGSLSFSLSPDSSDCMIMQQWQNFKSVALPKEYFKNEYYEVLDGINIQQQIDMITQFVSNLLQETIDLKPEYSKWVDENFWDLF